MPHRYMYKCPVCDRKDVLNIVLHLKTVHRANANDWLFKAKLLYLIVVYQAQTYKRMDEQTDGRASAQKAFPGV